MIGVSGFKFNTCFGCRQDERRGQYRHMETAKPFQQTKPIVQVDRLTKKIGSTTIIHDLSFDLYPGEVFGLLGPNGAGKTTTIRLMLGLMSITKGDVRVHGYSIQTEFEQAIAHVGAMLESPEMYPYLTGYENLVHYARMVSGVTTERIQEVIEWSGLHDRIDEKVHTYSLGMRQRLALAQALLHAPSVLILDEPTNGLDPAGIRDVRHRLMRLTREEGMAVLISSHLLPEMEQMCDRVGMIQKGRLVDIQSIRGFAHKSKHVRVSLTVHPLHKATSWVQERYPQNIEQVRKDGLEISIPREHIPRLVSGLVQAGLQIYEVRVTSKTLEDRFLEVLGGHPLEKDHPPDHE